MDQSRSGQWIWNEQEQKYYYLNAATKEIVDQNGTRLPLSHAQVLGPEVHFDSRREDTGSSKTVQTVAPATGFVAAGVPLPDMRSVQMQQNAYNSRRLSNLYRHADFSPQRREAVQLEAPVPPYTIRKDAGLSFKPGRVFHVLWTEPAGALSEGACSESLVNARFGERAYAKIRRFVVVRAASSYCSALPITSYGGRGVGKPGVKKSEHCIIYTGRSAPLPLLEEFPRLGEAGMQLTSIRVISDDGVAKLDPSSRLDLGKPHTIHHNIKVKAFGQVDALHLTALLSQFKLVWSVPSPSVHIPPPSGGPPRSAARVHKLREAATKEEESSSDEEEDDTSESEGERQTSMPKDPDMPIDFSLFDELKTLQVNHVKILQLGELFGALKCSGFDTDAITAIATAQSKSERASAVSRAGMHSPQAGDPLKKQPSKLREVTYHALLRRGYSKEQANDLLDSRLS
ncbi:hypothetical protein KC363_g8489 [Hortaea werneckii]|uniref:DUF6590 domain-containing protein n=1 Tax=Hortaea werneckii TaxID=91943 RepID=A0A3M7EZ54_HORWE|nr:hypothetical protein KC363_g8489 [Hortaea werneckii]RMY81800.1 hypothetical protein D0861_08169 [Hortaea werneckii]